MELNTTATPSTEYSREFLQGMIDRMGVSFCKYGLVADAYPAKTDAFRSARDRMGKYQETGNTEFLIDAANFLMIEFMHPDHARAHFKPTDSNESPGLISQSGERVRRHDGT